MKKILLGISALALISIATMVVAQDTDDSGVTQDRGTTLRLAAMDTSVAAFHKLDKDNDGRISPLEAADNPKIAAAFTRADKDKDGYLSLEEFEALGSTSPSGPDVSASSPSGDRATDPSGDQPATGPNEPSQSSASNSAPASHAVAHPRQ